MKERKERKQKVKRVDLETYHHTHKKHVWEMMDVLTFCGDHFTVCTYINRKLRNVVHQLYLNKAGKNKSK